MKTYKVTLKTDGMRFETIATDVTAENVDLTLIAENENEGRKLLLIATVLGAIWERCTDVDGITYYMVDGIPFEYLEKVEIIEE